MPTYRNFKEYDVVSVPFPFTDKPIRKKRPAVIISKHAFHSRIGHSVMAMVTSAKNTPWPLDVMIEDLESAGLKADSVIRMKLFTLDHRFVIRKVGTLAMIDQQSLMQNLKACFII